MTILREQVASLLGGTLYGAGGAKVGAITHIFLDDVSRTPEWAGVRTGLLGRTHVLVPLEEATSDGENVTVPYAKDLIRNAPGTEDDDGHISADQERALRAHYAPPAPAGAEPDAAAPRAEQREERPTGQPEPRPAPPTADDAMTRSEEHLVVGTERVPAGTARLRKYVTTEQVETTVPVRKEHVVLEQDGAPVGAAGVSGAAAGAEPVEIVLREERPVITTETVPVERVRLGTRTEQVEQTVTGEVRRENIEVVEERQPRT